MSVRAAVVALCVFLSLLASAGVAEVMRAPPISPASKIERTPTVKPDRAIPATLPKGVSVARQCVGSTIFSRVIDAKGTREFTARFSQTAFDDMVGAGCTRIQQGCNTCKVEYTGCTAQQRAMCSDGDCLERVCTRRMICSVKACKAYSDKAPPCRARFARHACLESAFDPLDSTAAPRE